MRRIKNIFIILIICMLVLSSLSVSGDDLDENTSASVQSSIPENVSGIAEETDMEAREDEEDTASGKKEIAESDESEEETNAEIPDTDIPLNEESDEDIPVEQTEDAHDDIAINDESAIGESLETDEFEKHSSESDVAEDGYASDTADIEGKIYEQENNTVRYIWDELSEDEFIRWIADPLNSDYIMDLFNSGNEEYIYFLERVESIADYSLRESILSYLKSLFTDPVEGDIADITLGNYENEADPQAYSENGHIVFDHSQIEISESIFPGPSASFSLSRKQKDIKRAIGEAGTAEYIRSLQEGKDYVESTLIFSADDVSYAQAVADVYGAELKDCSFGVAEIRLQYGTVAEAVALASDTSNQYPPVEPEWIIPYVDEPEITTTKSNKLLASSSVPVSEDWNSWVNAEDAILKNPDLYLQDPFSPSYQWQHDMMNTYEAWGVTTGSDAVTVAVIDSGVNSMHPDLHDVTVDSVSGLSTEPYGSHATHVAGIIAATLDNGIGGAGIAPGVRILSIRVVKVDNNGRASISNANLTRAINKAVAAKADIINISIGGADHDTVLETAIDDAYDAGVTVIASAGNYGDNCMMYPAGYSTVIAVGNVNRAGYRASSSSYGKWVDISAPGEEIMSTSAYGYAPMSGTSMACPMVSGAAALYMSRMGHVSPQRMRSVLLSSVTKCSSSGMGTGIIDAAKMFAADKTAPVFELDDYQVSGTVVAKASSLLSFTGLNSDGAVIYTTNGSIPTIANGSVRNGSICENDGLIIGDLGSVGTTWTIKAAFVSNIGVRSNVATLKVTIAGSDTVTSLHIAAPAEFKAGRSVRLGVSAEPKYGAADATWSIAERNGCPDVTISEDGLLHAYSTDFGIVRVRATSAVDDSIYDETEIVIKSIDLVSAISLPKTATLVFSKDVQTSKRLSVKFKTKSGTVRPFAPTGSYDGIQAAWSSSNKKAVSVDENGVISAVGTGVSVITCRALDGSGVKKTCRVTVKRGADSITVKGQNAIAPGKNAVYKPVFSPSATANKSVAWSLENAPEGVTITPVGKLIVPADTLNDEFYVCATAKDGSGVIGKINVSIVPRVTSLMLEIPREDQGVRYTTYYGSLKTMTLYTVNIPNSGRTENTVDLNYYCVGSDYSLLWTSSNSSVASVDQNGIVTAHKKGTATISIRSNDGSGKKASVTVYVKVPASSLTIVPSRSMPSGDCYIGVGCSVGNKAVVGTGFGSPNSSKVTWNVDTVIANIDGDITDVTDYWKSKKWVSVTSAGTVKVSKNAAAYVKNYGLINVYISARRAEESVEDQYIYTIIPKVTSLTVQNKSVRLNAQTGDGNVNREAVLIRCNSATDACIQVSSSNPEIVGASVDYDDLLDMYYIVISANKKTGKAYITVKANDGSGKTEKIIVYVS